MLFHLIIKVLDMLCYEENDFLGKELSLHVSRCILHSNYPWYYLDDITRENVSEDEYSQPGFQHTPFVRYKPSSQFFDSISFLPGLIGRKIEELTDYKYDDLMLNRVRVGLNIPLTDESRKFNLPYNFPHVDCNAEECMIKKHWTALYYVNDSDGATYIFEDTEEREKAEDYIIHKAIAPRKDKLLIFDGEQYHASSSPIKANNRVVITVNFHAR